MFSFQWRMFRVSALTGAEEYTTLQHQDLVAAQDALKRDLQQWVARATMEMHRALGEAALNAKNLLEKNGKVQPRNLKPLFDAFETFKAIDFTGSSSFQDIVNRLKTQFGVTDAQGNVNYELSASNINHLSSSMEQFKELLGQVADLAQDDVAKEAGLAALSKVGEFKRFIEV
jgi:hypothetical protein